VKREGNATIVTYRTPVGSVSYKVVYTEEMKQAGISQTWISEHVIKKPEDYAVMGFIFKNIKIHPAYDSFSQYQKELGKEGLCGVGEHFGVSHAPYFETLFRIHNVLP